jgi:MFS family permease
MRVLVFLIAGWAGFFVMGVEMLSGRILAPYFGNSVHVWGGIITIYMLALSVGYLAGGKLSLYHPTLKRLAIILLLAAITTLPVVLIGSWVLDFVSDFISDPRYGTLISSVLLFFIPTFFCGMVSPYAIRLLVSEHLLSGQFAGRLYFVSTLGSAIGTLATSFYLVLYWEVNHIILTLIFASIVISTTIFLWRVKHA